jgi:hypothetical protein
MMNNKEKTTMRIFFVTLVLTALVFTGNSMAAGVGSTAGTTLLQPVSAKTAGTAEACTALAGDIISLHYNPAGLASFEGQDASMMYQLGFGGDSFAAVIYGKKLSFATIGASLLLYSTGIIELEDLNGNSVKKVGQSDTVLTVGAAKKLGSLNLGLGMKAISSQIFGNGATAMAVDIGAQYDTLEIAGGTVNLGIAIQNFGSKLTYGGRGEYLPLKVRIGGAYKRAINETQSITAYLDFPYYIYDSIVLGQLGIEYMPNSSLFIRGGYRYNISSPVSEMEPLALGIGFVKKKYLIDYSFSITKGIGIPHRLSIKMKI